ncbi:MAG: fatty acid cis/trans isomerase [Sulfurospirillum sp.]|nr:fatty acid cis/trans isomerase [Sulfurospirillum sp.]MBL0703412.1 fatty acid cis/trans isomerase [Sulfurospirillum sp.]
MFVSFFLSACSAKDLAPVDVTYTHKNIDYNRDVKPVLDSRCVVCHSCYNSPCQAKFSSYEGIQRGGSKIKVYDAKRLRAIDPTRLFVDAQTPQEWRTKGFSSLVDSLDSNNSTNDSIMIHMLNQKIENPDIVGDYSPETDTLHCPKDKDEVNMYFDEKPNHGMPYGMPSLKQVEYDILAQWLHLGAKGPSQNSNIKADDKIAQEIKKWEIFFNTNTAKYSVTARYLYEHLYLAQINFSSSPDAFYELIRSYTPSPQDVKIIPTIRPFDDPKVDKFYYRFRKINSTIVHKTHMVIKFDSEKFKRINSLFIDRKWDEKPHFVDYGVKSSANPFIKFAQIPVYSRYQFLLDNSHYIIMNFIRGPVCRGQMALNVIQDHFWVMFKDPNYDLSVKYSSFLSYESKNLSMPIETNNKSVFKSFSDKYRDKYEEYLLSKQRFYDIIYPKGEGLDSIWKGERAEDTPLLTVYRHYDSASVHKGVLGNMPKTAWVIDYPQFERIYYSLVAGYDVFGNVSHQTNIRRYMDFLRIEGEMNFLAYMPKHVRLDMFKSWYIQANSIQKMKNLNMERESGIEYKTENYKSEFFEQIVNENILKSTKIEFDKINHFDTDEKPPKMPKEFNAIEDIENGFRSLKKPGTNFLKYLGDNSINIILLRVKTKEEGDYVGTLVVNKWHDNVNSIFGEKNRLNSNKDTMDFVPMSIGSYPNLFGVIEHEDLSDFFDLLENFELNEVYLNKFKKYFVSRDDKNFWEIYDWFQDNFNNSNPTEAGLYDLNRYYKKSF